MSYSDAQNSLSRLKSKVYVSGHNLKNIRLFLLTPCCRIEIKAGSTGSLKSLHLFMGLKNLDTAIRINSSIATKTRVEIKGHSEKTIKYTLLSMPFYLMWGKFIDCYELQK